MHTDHEAPNTDVNPEALKSGHEPDRVNVRTILYVPVALLITFAFAFGVVTLLINFMRSPARNPPGNSIAADQNRTPKDQPALNKRFDKMKGPRLEGLDQLDSKEAPYVISSVRTEKGNSPDYHPEDIRPDSRYIAGTKRGEYRWEDLHKYQWKDKEKRIMQIPINEAMKILLNAAKDSASEESKKLNEKLQFKTGKLDLDELQAGMPKASNPFWGIKSSEKPKETPKGGGH